MKEVGKVDIGIQQSMLTCAEFITVILGAFPSK